MKVKFTYIDLTPLYWYALNSESRNRQINHTYIQSKIILTIFLIIILGINNSIASQTLRSEVYVTKQGSKFHYNINTPTFWDLNQTHNVTISFEIDAFADDIEIIEGQIGLHVKVNNNFTHYYGFHPFGPYIDIQSLEEFNRIRELIIYSFLFDVLIRYIPNEITFQFTIDLYLFDLLENVNPTTLIFYLAFNFHETTLDQYSSGKHLNDPSMTQKIGWVKAAEYRINPPTNNRSIPIWLIVAMIVLLVIISNTKRK